MEPATIDRPARREDRYAVRFPVRLAWNRRSHVSMVEDVSFRGMRIRAAATPALRELVRIDLELPDAKVALSMHAMVAHITRHEGCEQPAIGLQFYGVGEEELVCWQEFVRRVRQRGAGAPDLDAVSFITEVEPKTPTELELVRIRASVGSVMFLETELDVAVGRPLHTAVVHPEDRGRMFLLEGVVSERVDEPSRRGMVVHFNRLDVHKQDQMKNFTSRHPGERSAAGTASRQSVSGVA